VKYIIVYTTIDTKESAKDLATNIIASKLACCVQIKEIDSIYSWKDKICEDKEYQLTIKTKKLLYKELEEFIKNNHSYDTAQITSVDISDISDEYARWCDEVTK
jgi:periplasmic divalent cation tolerance protein